MRQDHVFLLLNIILLQFTNTRSLNYLSIRFGTTLKKIYIFCIFRIGGDWKACCEVRPCFIA